MLFRHPSTHGAVFVRFAALLHFTPRLFKKKCYLRTQVTYNKEQESVQRKRQGGDKHNINLYEIRKLSKMTRFVCNGGI